jgi:hypothetical protein
MKTQSNNIEAQLQQLAETIKEGRLQNSPKLFQGANLVMRISPPTEDYKPQDVIVVTEDAYTISSLIFALKEIFAIDINSMNKYAFYPAIGKALNKSISAGLNTQEQMLNILDLTSNMKFMD